MEHPIEAIMALIQHYKVTNINALSGLWEFEIDETWRIAANGHKEPIHTEPKACMAVDVQPFSFVVWFNGWLAGDLAPLGDGWFADVEGGNAETFIQAVQKHIGAVTAGSCRRRSDGCTTAGA